MRTLIGILKEVCFGDDSLLKQAYFWFAISIIGTPTSLFLPNRILLICTNILSWLALLISAQAFIAAAKANKKLTED